MSGNGMRYVVVHSVDAPEDDTVGVFTQLKAAHQAARTNSPYREGTVYELGDEVKEPRYGPLVEWATTRFTVQHPLLCDGRKQTKDGERYPCTCGLTDALKAAGL